VSYKAWLEAKRLFNKGHLAYKDGNYEEAILKWQRAVELSKEPLIHESLSNAYERLGKLEKAIDHLARWREEAPEKEQARLDTRLENLALRLAEQQAEEQARQEAEQKRKADEAERKRKADEAERKRKREAEEAERRRREQQAGQSLDWLPWTVIGVGGAAVIAGVVMDAVAAGKRPDTDVGCIDNDGGLLCRAEQRDDIESSNSLAIAGDVTWIAGSAVAATGVVLLFVLDSGDDASATGATTRWSPVLSPDQLGINVRTRW
jgi:tetratricopeptide (TPR) repeat protein